MKKSKKKQNAKNVQKGKWSVGKTVASVIGSVALITGTTVLGVYLAGGFEERVVNPESISFSYGEDLDYRNGQLEVSGDIKGGSFMLTITTPTEMVTANRVSLSFEGYNSTSGGYVSNNIIRVPKEVTLGQPFEVKLLTTPFEYDGQSVENVNGGISTLIAKSEYLQTSTDKITIAVDTPVYAIETYLTDMSGNRIESVGANTEFKVESNFYPAKSKYMFGDGEKEGLSESEKRTKKVFFGATQEGVTPIYDSKYQMHFRAKDEIIAGINIRAYAFKNAQTQLLQEANSVAEDDEEFYIEMYRYLASHEGEYIQKDLPVEMASATVGSFDIARAGDTITVLNGEKTSIYVNSYENNKYLGATIISTEDEELTFMLQNLALAFSYTDGTEIEIGEDKPLKVGGREIQIDGKSYYLPYNEASDKNYCYWDITTNFSSVLKDINVEVYLVMDGADEEKTLFKVGDNIQSKSFVLKTNEVEDKTPTFVGQDETTFVVPQEVVTLGVEESQIKQTTLNLKDYIIIPAENKYKNVQFLARFESEETMNTIIKGNYVGIKKLGSGMGEESWYILPSENITLYGAGTFDIRFLTIKPDGTTVKLCEATKTFICQQELSKESVSSSSITAFVDGEEKTGDIYLAQGQVDNDYLSVEFAINSASKEVFKGAFSKNQISLVDDTDKFDFLPGVLDEENNTLTFKLWVKTGITIESDISITSFKLVYNNGLLQDKAKTVTWYAVKETNCNIYVYCPVVENINVIDAPESASITQKLNTNGEFETTIEGVENCNNVQDLIDRIVGNGDENIVITDQHGRKNTLLGNWKFYLVESEGNVVSIKNQTFEIKSSGEVVLGIKSADDKKESTYRLTITASATGVNHLTYQNNPSPENTDTQSDESTILVSVSKYGVKNEQFVLANLVKYYIDEEETSQYTNIVFKFSSNYIASLSDEQILALFGENGMLEINETFFNDTAENIRRTLRDIEVESIKIREDFGISHALGIEITDPAKVVNTSFNFTILNNIDVSDVDYELYAAEGEELSNVVNYKEGETTKTLGEIYSEKDYYVIIDGDMLSITEEEDVNAVATIKNGVITFTDFFDDESKTFTMTFNKADNMFALNKTISFVVKRNIVIEYTGNSFVIIGGNDNLSSYLTFKRLSTGQTFNDFVPEYYTNGSYLNVNDNQLSLQQKLVFAYNEQNLLQRFDVRKDGRTLYSFDLKITLTEKDFYSLLAEKLKTADETIALFGSVQKVDGVKYIVLNTDKTQYNWKLANSSLENNGSSAIISLGGVKNIYSLSSETDFRLQTQSKTLAGLGNENYYMRFIFKSADGDKQVIAEAYVPIIISAVGDEPIDLGIKVDNDKKLEMAILSGDELYSNEYYNEFPAGQVITLEALKFLEEGQTVVFDENAFLDNSNLVNKNLIKYINIKDKEISLNHLNDDYDFMLLPLVWTVGDQQFHYLIKITPDVETQNAVYAYDGDAEHISCQVNSSVMIDFNEEFNENTLHSGKKRFSVTKNNIEITDILESYYIQSVTVGTNSSFFAESEWRDYVEFFIDNGKITITPKTDKTIVVVVGHSYPGGENSTDLSVIAKTDKTYTIVLNQNTKHYAVRFSEGEKSEITNDFTWEINNSQTSSPKIYDLKIELLDQTNSLNTVEYDLLNVFLVKGEENAVAGCEYNKTKTDATNGIPSTTLRLTMHDYISKDEDIEFAVYTKYGYLASLKVHIQANASVELNDDFIDSTLTGGKSYSFGKLFKVSLNGEEKQEGTSYTISSIEFKAVENNAGVFAKWGNNRILVADLFEDTAVIMNAELKFGENKTYTFSQKFTLKSNATIKYDESDISKDVIAGKTLSLNATDFATSTNSNLTISCTNGDGYTVENNGGSIAITPNYVGSKTSITVKLKLSLEFNGATQSKEIEYTFSVSPCVEISPQYPNPNGETLDREYIKSNTSFDNILKFLQGTAFYGEGSRLSLKNITGKDIIESLDWTSSTLSNEDLVVKLSKKNYASVKVGEERKEVSIETDLPLNEKILFTRVSGGTSLVTIMVTYKGVTASYDIEILDEIFNIETNYQTRNISQGEFENNNVTYEKVYVDKTNTSDIFAEGRMVEANLNASLSGLSGQYMFVYEKAGEYYVSWIVNILEEDRGTTRVYDLGISMAGKTLVGIYRASELQNKDKFSIDHNVLKVDEDKDILTDGLNTITNYKDNLFTKDPTLRNRIQLKYAGFDVAYDKFKGSVASKSIEATTTIKIDEIAKIEVAYTNDNNSIEFTYYFMPKLDIEVDAKTTSAGNYLIIEANAEQDSIVSLFGIRHPSSNSLAVMGEFNDEVTMTLSVLENIEGTGLSAYSNFGFKKITNDNKDYLRTFSKANASNGVYDYSILPLGAKNDGDFVLTKLSYYANGFKQVFYVVIQILPDYKVIFNGLENGINEISDGKTILSNNETIVAINDIKKGSDGNTYYKDFRLTSDSNADGILSIKHKNGVNTERELASSFSISMTENQGIYNAQTNIKSKLKLVTTSDSGETAPSDKDKWTKDTDNVYKSKTGDTSFSEVEQAVFGDQLYFIDCQDSYGYAVRLYFKLELVSQSSPRQYSSSPIQLKEGEEFDITARYELLSINETGVTKTENGKELEEISITSTPTDPEGNEEISLIELAGIQAWMFSQDSETYLSGKTSDGTADVGYNVNDSYYLSDESLKKYLEVPIIQDVKITGIRFVDAEGKEQEYENFDEKIIATSTNGVFNGLTNIRGVDSTFTMPVLNNKNAFGLSNTARITMYITLKYGDSEVYDCPVEIELTREESFTGNATTVVDGEIFNLTTAGYKENNGNSIGIGNPIVSSSTTTTFINDTLEVKIPANQSVEFTLALTRNEEEISHQKVSLSNAGYSYDKTYYISLSNALDEIVAESDTITISGVTNASAGFTYICNTENAVKVDETDESKSNFIVSSITNDIITVDSALQLGSMGYYTTEKHYVINGYRYIKTYYVTGKYYKLEQSSSDEIMDVLNESSFGGTAFEDWAKSLNFYNLLVTDKGEFLKGHFEDKKFITNTGAMPDFKNLYVEIDGNEGTEGVAINENGVITTPSTFSIDNYVKLNIYQKVNIKDGKFEKNYLGSVRLGLERYGKSTTTVKDGEEFNLFNASFKMTTDEDGNEIYGRGNPILRGATNYIADTLEIKVEANKSVTFELTKNGADSKEITINNSENYSKTTYLSISEQFDNKKVVQEGDTITISNINSSSAVKFVYAGNEVSGNFVIKQIENDRIFVDSENQLIKRDYTNKNIFNGYCVVEKYYVVDKNRVTKRYYVTAKAFQVTGTTSYQDNFNHNYDSASGTLNEPGVPTTFEKWAKNSLRFYDLLVKTDSVDTTGKINDYKIGRYEGDNLNTGYGFDNGEYIPDPTQYNLSFEIDNDNGNISGATIDENGTITLPNDFKKNENFISVKVYMKLANNTDRILLCFVDLKLKSYNEGKVTVYENNEFSLMESSYLKKDNGDEGSFSQIYQLSKNYIADTLEVLVPQGEVVTFNLTRNEITKECSLQGLSYDKVFYISLSEVFGEIIQKGEIVTISSVNNASAEFSYAQSSITDSFTIKQVDKDIISIKSDEQFDKEVNGGKYCEVKKFYVVDGYRMTKTYYVTSRFFNTELTVTDEQILNNKFKTSYSTWSSALNFNIYDLLINDKNEFMSGSYVSGNNGLFKNKSLQPLNNNDFSVEYNEEDSCVYLYDSNGLRKIKFKITSGNAEFDTECGIILLGDFNRESELKISVYGNNGDNLEQYELGQIGFKLKVFEENLTTINLDADGTKEFSLLTAGNKSYDSNIGVGNPIFQDVSTYIADTLEVLVPQGEVVTFNLTRNEITKECSLQGLSYDKVFYISLSEVFGEIIQKGEIVTISNVNNASAKFSYAQSSITDSFIIKEVDKETISIKNDKQFDKEVNGGKYCEVKKFYVVDGYRIAKTYYVAPFIFSIEDANTIYPVLYSIGDTTDFDVWAKDIKIRAYNLFVSINEKDLVFDKGIMSGSIFNKGEINEISLLENKDIFYFTCDESKATIDENFNITLLSGDEVVVKVWLKLSDVNLCDITLAYEEKVIKVNNVSVYDGKKFNLRTVAYAEKDGKVGQGKPLVENASTYIADTLDVLVSPQQTVKFSLSMTRNGSLLEKEIFIENTDEYGYWATTSYFSLSEIFGVTIRENDQIRLFNVNNQISVEGESVVLAKFSYAGKTINNDDIFEVSNIDEDVVFSNKYDYSNDFENVARYYIVDGCKTIVNYKVFVKYGVEIGDSTNQVLVKGTNLVDNWLEAVDIKFFQAMITNAEEVKGDEIKGVFGQADSTGFIPFEKDARLTYADIKDDIKIEFSLWGLPDGYDKASIDKESGTIYITDDFTQDEYISVVIELIFENGGYGWNYAIKLGLKIS